MTTTILIKCTYCDAPAGSPSAVTTDQPLCPTCEDLMILTDKMATEGLDLTVETVSLRLAQARRIAPSGWAITPADVGRLLPGFLAARGNGG